jgi:hypothetical protein
MKTKANGVESRNMVFQVITSDKSILTVRTEVGDGLSKVVIEEDRNETEDEPDESSLDNPGD